MLDDNFNEEWARYNFFPAQESGTPAPTTTTAPPYNEWGILPNGGNRAGYQDLSYWMSRGVTPDQIFDANGQTLPGWSRTGNGYERAGGQNVDVTPTTTPTIDPIIWNTGGTGGNDDWGIGSEPFLGKPPSWMAGPQFTAPTFTPPPAFEYKTYEAPTIDSVYADPSYQFRKGEGEKALAQRIASTGAYRTGGTLKDFINYNQNAASQEYSNIFNRSVDAHNMGLQQALGTYATNYGVGRDTYDRLFDAKKAEFAPLQRENELMNQRQFDSFLADFDIFDRNRKRASDNLFRAAELGG